MGVITFNNIPSTDVGIVVENFPNYQYAERNVTSISVPGRNGDILYDDGSYKNVKTSYQIAFGGKLTDEFAPMARQVASWLHSASGYARLEDTYDPEVYRLAQYKENVNLTNLLSHAGRATINFDCKPQRFLKSGEEAVIVNVDPEAPDNTYYGYVDNPSNMPSKPIVLVHGNGDGSVYIGAYQIVLTDIDEYIVIDSELQDCYKDLASGNQNGKVTLPNGYPIFQPGINQMSIYGPEFTHLEVFPRWWVL